MLKNIQLLIFVAVFVETILAEVVSSPPYVQRRDATKEKDSFPIICANGIRSGANCVCKAGFTGKNCHLKMNCEGFERKIDGECAECKQNYEGKFCELPICKNGNVHEHEQRCVNCEEPYSGDHCSNLKKSDVLYYYNKKMKMMGPIGVLSIIPMILIFLYCERKSNARKVNRVVSIYDGDSMDTNKLSKQAVRRLLVEK